MPKVKVKDKTGLPITIGDYIVYGHLLGRSAGLKFGKVLDIKEKDTSLAYESPYRITVIGIDDGWDCVPTIGTKTGTLQFPDRILTIDGGRVPLKHRDLLDKFEESYKAKS